MQSSTCMWLKSLSTKPKDFVVIRKANVDATQCIEWLFLCAETFKLPNLVTSVSASALPELGDTQLFWPCALVYNLVLPQRPLSEFLCTNDVFLPGISGPTFMHKKLFILPKMLPFSYAKSPQNLISGALQQKSSMSWCFSSCIYLENFHFTSKLFTYLLETYVKRS